MKTALIVGITGDIGKRLAADLANRYQIVGINSTNCDIRHKINVLKFVENLNKVDLLINAAGVSTQSNIEDLSLEDIKKVYEVNVLGTVNCCQAIIPKMKSAGRGYIINIGSLRGVEPFTGKASYAMSKASVRMFSKILSLELEPYGIKVTCINPGFIYSNFIKKRIQRENLQPENILQTEDISRAVNFILSLSPGASVTELNLGKVWNERAHN